MTDAVRPGVSDISPARPPIPSERELLWIVGGCVAVTQMSWGIVVPVLPIYAADLGANAFELGIIVAAFNVARLLVNIPAGELSQRMNRRHLLVVSVAGAATILALTSLATTLALLVASRFILGLCGGVAITTANAVLADATEPQTRGSSLATLQALQLAGASIGPAAGGLVAGTFGPRATYLLAGAVAAAMAGLAVLRLPALPPPSPLAPTLPPGSSFGLLRVRNFRAICLVGFSVFFNRIGGQQTLLPLVAYTAAHISVGTLGVLLSATTALNLLTVRFAGRLSDRRGRKAVIAPSMFLGGVGYFLYLGSTGPVLFAVTTLVVGFVNGFNGPIPAAYCADVAPDGRRGQAVGMYRTFGDLAGLCAPLMLGALVTTFGLDAGVVVVGLVASMTAIVFSIAADETVGTRARSPYLATDDGPF